MKINKPIKDQKEIVENPIVASYVLPGLPHPLLCPEKNPGWGRVRDAFQKVEAEIRELPEVDLIIIYSTMWPSVIGHQIQADPMPEWVHVDEQFHDLGSIPYKLRMDSDFAQAYDRACKSRGLHSRTVNYKGFPIDTGSIVALQLINPNNRLPAVIVSSNVYADRAETVVLGKAAVDALKQSNKRAVAVIVSTLSNRLHKDFIEPSEDKIHSLKDEEWNQKILELLGKGRLEDVEQLSRQIHREARVKKVGNFKPFWWLASISGAHNWYTGKVLAYEPVYGTGSAVVSLKPSSTKARDLEFDEEDPDTYHGERNVLDTSDEYD